MSTPAQELDLEQKDVTEDVTEDVTPEEADAAERALFLQEIDDDPDLDHLKTKQEEPEQDKPPEAKKPEKAEKEPTGLEWLDDIPEDRRKTAQAFIERQGQEIARLDQRVKSHLGQLRPAQRTIAQQQQRIRQLREQQPKTLPTNPNIEAQKKAYADWVDEEYSEFPEEAQKLKTRYGESLDGVLGAIPATTTDQPETLAGPDPKEEVQHLATAYSDWGERRFSPAFEQWFEGQDSNTQSLLNSPLAADNVELLDAFTRDNPDWEPPQSPEDFYSPIQAQHSPLFRGWCEGEGINPDTNFAVMPDYKRDQLMNRFKTDLGAVQSEQEPDPKVTKLRQRRSNQLQDRGPGSRRVGVTPGAKLDWDSDEAQRAYFKQLIAEDPDLNH